MAHDLSNYVEVADRLVEFYAKHPQGRIITEILELNDKRVSVKAAVYRDAAEIVAGVGHSAMAIPGATPYTRGSELENCETSAVGRALVMAGLSSKKVASADEVRAKRSEPTIEVAPAVKQSEDEMIYSAAVSVFDPEPFETVKQFVKTAEVAIVSDSAKGLGICWKHNRPWKLKEGTSIKTGKPYSFWSCSAKDVESRSGWCEERPTPAWIAEQDGVR